MNMRCHHALDPQACAQLLTLIMAPPQQLPWFKPVIVHKLVMIIALPWHAIMRGIHKLVRNY